MEATLQVLLKEGYAKLTTTRVADRAGVSVGTLYQYYPDKRSLVTALHVRYMASMVEALRSAVQRAEGKSIEAALRVMLGALLQVKLANLDLVRALRAPMAEVDGAGFARETLEQFVAAALPALLHSAPALKHAERRATLLVAALEGAIAYAGFEAPEWLGSEDVLEDMVTLATGFVRGCLDRDEARRSPKKKSAKRRARSSEI